MNCLDYRRILLAEACETDSMREHRMHCVPCGELLKEHAAFEGELRGALEVPVPARFADRLLDALPAAGGAETPRQDRRQFLAAAAAAAGAIGLGLYAWRGRDDPMAMGLQSLAT